MRTVLDFEQESGSVSGGGLAFGPDGMLYVGVGDGEPQTKLDPLAQDLTALNGSILRIGVGTKAAYDIPADNPFLNQKGARGEIWAFGVRNPRHISVTPSGQVIVLDDGAEEFEEINWVQAGDNLGWPHFEGPCPEKSEACSLTSLRQPVHTYDRRWGTQLSGGVFYSSGKIAILQDKYVFSDFTRGYIWAIDLPKSREDKPSPPVLLGKFSTLISAFTLGADGELYALDQASGGVLKVEPAGGTRAPAQDGT